MARYGVHYDGRSGWILYLDGEAVEFCNTLAEAIEAFYLVTEFEPAFGEGL